MTGWTLSAEEHVNVPWIKQQLLDNNNDDSLAKLIKPEN